MNQVDNSPQDHPNASFRSMKMIIVNIIIFIERQDISYNFTIKYCLPLLSINLSKIVFITKGYQNNSS